MEDILVAISVSPKGRAVLKALGYTDERITEFEIDWNLRLGTQLSEIDKIVTAIKASEELKKREG